MKIIYTDENKRLRDFGEIMSSYGFRSFVENNRARISKYDYGIVRVKPELSKNVFNLFLKERGFLIGDKTEHANGIGNNNMSYVQDLESGEYIGAIHLNSDMYGGMYCYASDIHRNKVSDTYLISRNGITLEHPVCVDWSEYKFSKEEQALNVIEDAIKVGVLMEGPSGGVMVYKEFEGGKEGWSEVDKEYAARDLVEQDKVDTLLTAVNKRKLSLDAQLKSAESRSSVSEEKVSSREIEH